MHTVRRRFLGLLAGGLAVAALATGPVRAADPIKIGLSMPQTGGLAGGGKSALLALEVWKDEMNAKGGLLGRPVQLIYYDDQSNPALVPGIYTKLLDVDKVDLVISSYATNQIAPAMPIVIERKLVFMALFGTGVNDKFNYDKYFQILPNGKDTRLAPSLGYLELAMSMEPKPQTIAIAAADAEYAQTVAAGARETIARLGLKIVYDRSYPPSTVDYTPIVRGLQAANADVVFIASYPPDTVGIIRAAKEIGLTPKMFGGGMVGLGFTQIKQQLGPLLNGLVCYDVYAPEPTMKFPGLDDFLKRYQERAVPTGVDPLGHFLPPYTYAEMQILSQAITAVGSLDQTKIAAYIHATKFTTVVGDVKFAENGEWEKSRALFIQYQKIEGNGVDQFRQPGRQVILYPPELKSGQFIYPYADARR